MNIYLYLKVNYFNLIPNGDKSIVAHAREAEGVGVSPGDANTYHNIP